MVIWRRERTGQARTGVLSRMDWTTRKIRRWMGFAVGRSRISPIREAKLIRRQGQVRQAVGGVETSSVRGALTRGARGYSDVSVAAGVWFWWKVRRDALATQQTASEEQGLLLGIARIKRIRFNSAQCVGTNKENSNDDDDEKGRVPSCWEREEKKGKQKGNGRSGRRVEVLISAASPPWAALCGRQAMLEGDVLAARPDERISKWTDAKVTGVDGKQERQPLSGWD